MKKQKVTPSIIEGVIKGDLKSQNILYKNYKHFVDNIIFRRLQNKTDADIVFSNIMIKVFENIEKFDYNKPDAFVFTIAISVIKDENRKKKEQFVYNTDLIKDNNNPLEDLIKKEDEKKIEDLIEKFKNNTSEIFRITLDLYLKGYKYIEILNKMKDKTKSEGTVKSRIFNLKEKLKIYFNEQKEK